MPPTHLHWFIWRSQLRLKLNIFNLATAFCLNVSGCCCCCCIIGAVLTIDPEKCSCPSTVLEWLLAPERRLNEKSHKNVILFFNDANRKGKFFYCCCHYCLFISSYPSLLARLFLLRRPPTCGCTWTCCCGWPQSVPFRNLFTLSIVL